jgi:hypothetical protein
MTSDRLAWLCDEIVRTAVPQMIPVRVGDDGRLHGLPGIDVEIPGRAIKTAGRDGDEGCWVEWQGSRRNIGESLWKSYD